MMAKVRRTLSSCGAVAELAAAFNTSIATVAFFLEEILENLNRPFLGRITLASFVSVFTLHWMKAQERSWYCRLK
jgi:H+/Cl- antiporter ClcA